MNRFRFKNVKFKRVFICFLLSILLYLYFTILINDKFNNYIINIIDSKYNNNKINIKDNIIYSSLNKIVNKTSLEYKESKKEAIQVVKSEKNESVKTTVKINLL